MIQELHIGPLYLRGETQGGHVHVAVRGAGIPGQRPHVGTLTLSISEWSSMAAVAELEDLARRQVESDRLEINRLQVQRDQARIYLVKVHARLDRARTAAKVYASRIDELGLAADDNDPAVMATAEPIGAAQADLWSALGLYECDFRDDHDMESDRPAGKRCTHEATHVITWQDGRLSFACADHLEIEPSATVKPFSIVPLAAVFPEVHHEAADKAAKETASS